MFGAIKEFRFLFPAIKAMFVDRKVRKFVGQMLLITMVVAFFATIAVEVLIYKGASWVVANYSTEVSFK